MEGIASLLQAISGLGQSGAGLYTAFKTGDFMNTQTDLLKKQGEQQSTLFQKQLQAQADAENFDWSNTASDWS